MTQPKVATVKRGGSRFYVDPTTKEKVPGVTSILNMLPKEFLKFWAAKLVAETAVDNLPSLVGLAMNDRQGAIDYLKRAPQRNTGEAADTGSEVHDLCERLAKGERIGRVHPDLQPFVDGFKGFLDALQPSFLELEATVWSDTHGYAGSFDALATIGDEVIILDWKTTKSGVHEEVALQMTAYAMADYILRPDGTRDPLPDINGAAVVHLRPEGWSVVPVAISEDLFPIFLALKEVHRWEKEIKATVIGQPIAGGSFTE